MSLCKESVKPTYRVIIAGGRDFVSYELLKNKCLHILSARLSTHDVVVVSGHASGADTLGEQFAQEYGLHVELHPADWERYGRAAGPRRNAEMASAADALIAFWDGRSRGTANMIDIARHHGLAVRGGQVLTLISSNNKQNHITQRFWQQEISPR